MRRTEILWAYDDWLDGEVCVGWVLIQADDDQNQTAKSFSTLEEIASWIETRFAADPDFDILIPANYSNALLINHLAKHESFRSNPRCRIVPPIRHGTFWKNPEKIFAQAKNPPSCRGAQVIREEHRAVFGLADLVRRTARGYISLPLAVIEARNLLAAHPMKDFLSFFDAGCPTAQALLLGMIRDPRWIPAGSSRAFYDRIFAVSPVEYLRLILANSPVGQINTENNEDSSVDFRTIVALKSWMGNVGFNQNWEFSMDKTVSDLSAMTSLRPSEVTFFPFFKHKSVSNVLLFEITAAWLDMVCDFWKGQLSGSVDEFFWPSKYFFFESYPQAASALKNHLKVSSLK